jgi:hypothetical protein
VTGTALTESGARYDLEVVAGRLRVAKAGRPSWTAVAVYPDRIPFLEATVRWSKDGEFLCGFNAAGTRTVRLIPGQVRPGMVLWSPKGFRSTCIKQVFGLA